MGVTVLFVYFISVYQNKFMLYFDWKKKEW
jgi:hypothetical protein